MGPVCDRDGWEPRGTHKTCSGEGEMEGGREGGMVGVERVDSRRFVPSKWTVAGIRGLSEAG